MCTKAQDLYDRASAVCRFVVLVSMSAKDLSKTASADYAWQMLLALLSILT